MIIIIARAWKKECEEDELGEYPNIPGLYHALVNDKIIVRSTRQPFLDGCRALLAQGYDPKEIAVIMRHENSTTDSLRGPIGEAAKLTVKERAKGNAPVFAKWQPYAGPKGSNSDAP